MYINRTIKCLKRLQRRSIDDNLRQLVLLRQDRVLVNQSTSFFTSDSGIFFYFFTFFFLLFHKNGSVGRWETKHFMGMALVQFQWKLHGVKLLSEIKLGNIGRCAS